MTRVRAVLEKNSRNVMERRKKTVCVFCSSNEDVDKKLIDDAYSFGKQLAESGYDIVWGGCDMGCMGSVARGVAAGGGRVTGVITQHFIDMGKAFTEADNLIVAEDLQERKHIMQKYAHAFVILPGGFGTLDEMFDILATQIINQKTDKATHPVIIMNLEGFFSDLETFIEKLYIDRLAEEKYRELYIITDNPSECILFLGNNLN